MKSIVQDLREKSNLTQTELAKKSGLSLRTIQRVEAGKTPKGYTLNALAKVFNLPPETLLPSNEITKLDRVKLINFSSLLGLIIPFGGVLFPLILTYKTTDNKNRELGKCIVSVQIILTFILAISQIASPFIQKQFALHLPLFIFPLVLIIALNLVVVIANGISLNKKNDLNKFLKINYL